MLEYNFEPFTETFESPKAIESSNSPSLQENRPTMYSKYEKTAYLRPRLNYSTFYPATNWQEPNQQQYYQEPKQKSYFWLWLFPILGILILAYWYWKDDIDAFIKKSLKPMDAIKTDDKTLKNIR